jgi:hypothetical protein
VIVGSIEIITVLVLGWFLYDVKAKANIEEASYFGTLNPDDHAKNRYGDDRSENSYI